MTVANSAERSLVNFCRAMTSAADRGDHQGVEGENRENRYQFVNIYTYVISCILCNSLCMFMYSCYLKLLVLFLRPNLLAQLSRSPIPGSAGSASPCSESNATLPSRAVAGLDGFQDQSLVLHILTLHMFAIDCYSISPHLLVLTL